MGIPFSRSGRDRSHEHNAVVSFISSRDNKRDADRYGRKVNRKGRDGSDSDSDEEDEEEGEFQKVRHGLALPKLLHRRRFMSSAMMEMVNSAFIYACVVDLVTRAYRDRAKAVHEEEMYGREQEIVLLKSCCEKLQGNSHYLSHQLHVSEQKIHELSRKIEQAERHNEQVSAVESGSYQDEASTPMLLHTALESVTRGISIVASDLVSHIKQQRGSIVVSPKVLRPDVDANSGGLSLREGKIGLHSVIGSSFFQDFENQFGIPSHAFEKPKLRKRQFFQTYKKYRDMEPMQILQESDEFHRFVDSKRIRLGESLFNSLIAVTSNDSSLNEFEQQNATIRNFCLKLLDLERVLQHDTTFARGFLRLAKCVWLLYKLVFSFEPTAAEIFPVPMGSVFDEEYMEDMMKQGDYDDSRFQCEDGEDIMMIPSRVVKCMCTPGFIVRNTVVKARVYVNEL